MADLTNKRRGSENLAGTLFVCQIDGAVFTLNRDNGRRAVDIEPVPDCSPHVITFSGDKGQVAGLLPLPCFIFDDQEENVALVQEKGYWSGGVVFAREGIPVGRRSVSKTKKGTSCRSITSILSCKVPGDISNIL